MKDLIRHLESHLGPIDRGWSSEGEVRVLRFRDQPQKGIDTFATLGLSRKVLPMSGSRSVRQEFLASVRRGVDAEALASFLLSFAEYVDRMDQALLRGDVVGPSTPLIPEVLVNGVYAAMPVFFEGSFATFRSSSPPTVFVWLMPILASEAELVRARGWEVFEDMLETANVDFWDWSREAVRDPNARNAV